MISSAWIVRLSLLVAIVAVILQQLGIFDRPPVLLKDRVLDDPTRSLIVVAATCTSPDIGGNVLKLLNATKETMVQAGWQEAMTHAAESYALANNKNEDGTGSVAVSNLAVGLYFDDPQSTNTPRWAIGWAVDVDFEVAQTMVQEKQVLDQFSTFLAAGDGSTTTQQDEQDEQKQVSDLRAIRIGPGPALQAHIPYRNILTPMIAPMLQWQRFIGEFEENKKNYPATHNGRDAGVNATVACECYLSGPTDAIEILDYNLLLGDTTHVWEDAFPENEQVNEDESVA